MKHTLDYHDGKNVRDHGDTIETRGVHWGPTGLRVIHRAPHAVVLHRAGYHGWKCRAERDHKPAEYILAETGTWIILDRVHPGRFWRKALASLTAQAENWKQA